VPPASTQLVTVARVLAWTAAVAAMLEAELAVKRQVVAAALAPSHEQRLLHTEALHQALRAAARARDEQSVYTDDGSTPAHCLGDAVLRQPTAVGLLAVSAADATHAGDWMDAGAEGVPNPEQMSLYVSTLNLEAYVDGKFFQYIANTCNQMLMTQLSID
jgi:hypothetical protein